MVSETVSPKAGIFVGLNVESMVRSGKSGSFIVVDEQMPKTSR